MWGRWLWEGNKHFNASVEGSEFVVTGVDCAVVVSDYQQRGCAKHRAN